MSGVAARFETWGFDTPPRHARARSARVLEAVARSVEVRREPAQNRALVVATPALAPHAAPGPRHACAAYAAMTQFTLRGPGRRIDDFA